MEDKVVVLRWEPNSTKQEQELTVSVETVIEVAERLKEIIRAMVEQLRPLVEAVEDMFQKVLETDEEVLEEIMLYSNPSKKELLKMILEYKKIYKRYEPP